MEGAQIASGLSSWKFLQSANQNKPWLGLCIFQSQRPGGANILYEKSRLLQRGSYRLVTLRSEIQTNYHTCSQRIRIVQVNPNLSIYYRLFRQQIRLTSSNIKKLKFGRQTKLKVVVQSVVEVPNTLSEIALKMSETNGVTLDQTPSFEKTWGSSTSSGYCSEEDSDSEFEQYYTARTSFIRKPKKEQVRSFMNATFYPYAARSNVGVNVQAMQEVHCKVTGYPDSILAVGLPFTHVALTS